MKVLNLYSGLGGNRKLWKDVEVVAVESNKKIADVYKQNFNQDQVFIEDAHQFLIENMHDFDFIWSSPPCQSHSRMVKATRHKKLRYPDFRLYEEVFMLKNHFKGKWVVENVKPYYAPLIEPSAILGRHLFWSNFNISNYNIPSPPNFINLTNTKGANQLKEWLGIHYEGNIYYNGNHCPAQVLRNCVHPSLGQHVFNCSL